MRTLLTLALGCFFFLTNVHGQNISFQVEGGTNLTRISSFYNTIGIADKGLIVPGVLNLTNSNSSPFFALSETSVAFEPGFYINIKAYYAIKPESNWMFSSSIGLDLWRYNYDNSVRRENIMLNSIPNEPDEERWYAMESASLRNLNDSYGDVQTLYAEIQPINISYCLFQRKLSLQTGPVVSVKVYNTGQEHVAIKYNEGSSQNWEDIDDAYFSMLSDDDFKDVLAGWQISLQGRVSNKLSVLAESEIYFSPAFETVSPIKYLEVSVNSQNEVIDAVQRKLANKPPLPVQFKVGISYDIWKIQKKKAK